MKSLLATSLLLLTSSISFAEPSQSFSATQMYQNVREAHQFNSYLDLDCTIRHNLVSITKLVIGGTGQKSYGQRELLLRIPNLDLTPASTSSKWTEVRTYSGEIYPETSREPIECKVALEVSSIIK